MPSLALSSPSSIIRTGWTVDWTNIGNILNSPASYATSGAYAPNDKSKLIKIQIAAPIAPESALPTVLTVSLTGHLSPSSLSAQLTIDMVGVGTSIGIQTTGTSGFVLLQSSDHSYTFNVPTLGLSLSDFNSGLLFLYIGIQALPTNTTAFNPANWTVTSSPSNQVLAGPSPKSLSQIYTITATYTGTGTAPSYVDIQATSTATGEGETPGGGPENLTGTASVSDGQGGSDSGAIASPATDPPPGLRTSATTATTQVPVTGGVGSFHITPTATSSVSGLGPPWAVVSTGISGLAVVAPLVATAFLDSASISYVPYTVHYPPLTPANNYAHQFPAFAYGRS